MFSNKISLESLDTVHANTTIDFVIAEFSGAFTSKKIIARMTPIFDRILGSFASVDFETTYVIVRNDKDEKTFPSFDEAMQEYNAFALSEQYEFVNGALYNTISNNLVATVVGGNIIVFYKPFALSLRSMQQNRALYILQKMTIINTEENARIILSKLFDALENSDDDDSNIVSIYAKNI
jgi:hypothetical protein